MSNHIQSLEQLTHKIYQGITLSRYRDPDGTKERIVNIRDLEQLQIIADNLSMERLKVSNLEQYQLHENDVVVTIRGMGTSLKASVIKDATVGCLAGQNLAVLRPKSQVNPFFLAIVLRSMWLEQSLAKIYRQSSATLLISITQLRALEIPTPDLVTQDKIAKLFLSTERNSQITLKALEARTRLAELTLFQILEKQ